MTYLVTGATGNIGRRVVLGLQAAGLSPRVFVRDAAGARRVLGDGVDVVVGDLKDEQALEKACAGVQAMFLLTDGPDLAATDAGAARAARAQGVGRIVKLSSLGARVVGAPTAVALWHAQGEDAIRKSGVPHVFVQSVGFMSNSLAWAPSIKSAGVVRASTGDGRIAMVHPDDVAAVSVEALLTAAHEGRALAVTGPVALTYAEMVGKIAAVTGRTIRFEAITDAEAHRALTAIGLAPALAAALVTLWREVREGKVDTVTTDIERVTGRAPRSFEQWVTENASAFT